MPGSVESGKRAGAEVFGLTAGAEEPQTVADDAAAEGAFVDVVDLVDAVRLAGGADSSVQDGLVSESRSEPLNSLPPDLVMRADHAAGEPAVLGRDAAGENGRLLDGVFDEQRAGLCRGRSPGRPRR